VGLFLGLVLSTAVNASPRVWCEKTLSTYDDVNNLSNVTTLTGILRTRKEWGLPNFGENPNTDHRWTAYLLRLDHPISAVIFNSKTRREQPGLVKAVQLRGFIEWSHKYDGLVHHHVLASGLLSEPSGVPSDVGDLILETVEVRRQPGKFCAQRVFPLGDPHDPNSLGLDLKGSNVIWVDYGKSEITITTAGQPIENGKGTTCSELKQEHHELFERKGHAAPVLDRSCRIVEHQ
jgi:hypothetical protein